MKINFNNVRRQACFAHDKLVKKLNNATVTTTGRIEISVSDLQEVMDDLRMMIGSIAMTYEEGNDDFKDLTNEVCPMEVFNDED